MRHAYLVIAHNNFKLLQCLIDSLDDVRNDIYIHIDKKIGTVPQLSATKSALHIYSEYKVYWGDYSMVKTELFLLRKAVHGNYGYFHLLSGADFPIKSVDYICDFFEKGGNKDFIDSYKYYDGELDNKIMLYHIFPHAFSNISHVFKIRHAVRYLALKIQILCKIRRNQDIPLKKGSQWFSITRTTALFLLSKEIEIGKRFNHTFCPDEVFVQTMIYNSHLRHNAFKNEWDGNGNLRYIDWSLGNVKSLGTADMAKLMESNALFARKFNEKDIFVVHALKNKISQPIQ